MYRNRLRVFCQRQIYFDDYASDALKSYVKSGGEELQKCITNEDGELMAIPAPNLTASGVTKCGFVRTGWMLLGWMYHAHGMNWQKWLKHL